MHVFLCFVILDMTTFKTVGPTAKNPLHKPIKRETPIRSIYTCFPPTYSETEMSTGLNIDLLSNEQVKKFTCAS